MLWLCLICSGLCQQVPDTLSAARVSSVRDIPLLRPAEEIRGGLDSGQIIHLAEAVSRFTGIQVKDYGGLGGLKTINVRSLGSEHVGVFIDGIQIDNAQNMQVDLGRLSVESLSSLALYNNQKSVRLQTAKEYVTGASLHLTSSEPSADRTRLRLRGGSFGTVNPALQWEKRIGALSVRASAEYLASKGDYNYPWFDTTLVRENGDIRSMRLESQLFGALKRGEWRLRLYGYNSERGFPGPVIRRASGFPFSAERQADRDLFVQGAWIYDWTSRYSSAIRFKYANNYTHYATHPEKNPMALPYDLHYLQQSAYLSLAQSFTVSDHLAVDLSSDLQGNTLDSDSGQGVAPSRLGICTALAARFNLERFRIAAHLAYMGAYDSYADAHAGPWSKEDAWRDAWIPAASLCWTPFEWLETDVSAKRSYRLPSFNDLYYSLMGNSALEPESALQTAADLFLHTDRGAWTLEARLSPYYNRVSDKIVAIPTSSQFRWTMLNIGLADIAGIDLKGSASYASGPMSSCFSIRYSFQRALDHSTPGSVSYGNQLPYIPVHSASADFSVSWHKWTFVWNSQFSGEKWSRSANTADYHIDPWTISDAALTRDFHISRNSEQACIKISLRLANLFDRHYQIVQGYPMPGRSFLMGVDFSF